MKTQEVLIIAGIQRQLQGWMDTAEQETRNSQYYRSLLIQIAKDWPECYVQDDGGVVDSILVAKVPSAVMARLSLLEAELKKASRFATAPAPPPQCCDQANRSQSV